MLFPSLFRGLAPTPLHGALGLGFASILAGSPQRPAESSSTGAYRPRVRFPLLSTPPLGDAVTVSYRVQVSPGPGLSPGCSDALTGALGWAFLPVVSRLTCQPISESIARVVRPPQVPLFTLPTDKNVRPTGLAAKLDLLTTNNEIQGIYYRGPEVFEQQAWREPRYELRGSSISFDRQVLECVRCGAAFVRATRIRRSWKLERMGVSGWRQGRNSHFTVLVVGRDKESGAAAPHSRTWRTQNAHDRRGNSTCSVRL